MLKTTKTKFSYARKVLVLPLLFIVAFICLMEAQNIQAKATHVEILQAGISAEKVTAVAEPSIVTHIDKIPERSASVPQQNNEEITASGAALNGQDLERIQQDAAQATAVVVRQAIYMAGQQEAMARQQDAMIAQQDAMVARQGAVATKQEATVIQQAAIVRQQAERTEELAKNL